MIQLNPNKEYVKKGIYDVIFKQLNDFANINKLNADSCNYQQQMNQTPWFIIEINKMNKEVDDFIDRLRNLGLSISKVETVVWLDKHFERFNVEILDENILKIVQNLCNLGFKDHRYYDISKKMLVEPWGG